MKISDHYDPSLRQIRDSEATAKAKEAKVKDKKDEAALQTDTINLSPRSRLAAKAKAAAEAAPEVRVEKVDALKAQISAGDYKVDPDKVAHKLVEEHLPELI